MERETIIIGLELDDSGIARQAAAIEAEIESKVNPTVTPEISAAFRHVELAAVGALDNNLVAFGRVLE